ncbi:9230_t:CDS:2 [Scutellospora calospora]|uniref:9230_t:CDS:1 n=1 Tax=Scutellospora calospora TaxID=85575 RepID=A0ACA9L418_9GLOM|nr:9230_t:CDS:2 [Scutellospora calospora]
MKKTNQKASTMPLLNKKVDIYAAKFKRLLGQVDSEDSLLDEFIIRIFLSGLRGKTVTFVAVLEPEDLDKAIVSARRVEVGEYYSRQTPEKTQQKKLEEELDNLF